MVALSSVRSHWLDDSPAIVVSAEWLATYGFEVGSRVVIDVSQGIITIRPVDCEDDT
ncbi:MAG TPA: SymE family type I addiction module toxin [Pseudobacteroides sp.]|uniref:SymE family type I addiction module toxin n=1 Tax=Pseudobacteroides sp. TaxID=1968840 RepID=UPI002F93F657